MSPRRHRHEAALIIALTPAVLIFAVLAWLLLAALRALPWLLMLAGLVVACRWYRLHRRPRASAVRLVASQPDPDQAELARLRDDNAKLRTKVRVLSDMLTGEDARP
jgi:hypothetical protein